MSATPVTAAILRGLLDPSRLLEQIGARGVVEAGQLVADQRLQRRIGELEAIGAGEPSLSRTTLYGE